MEISLNPKIMSLVLNVNNSIIGLALFCPSGWTGKRDSRRPQQKGPTGGWV